MSKLKRSLLLILASLFTVVFVACGSSGNGGGNGDDKEVEVALEDNDSLVAPAVEQFLSITGVREIDYTDEISSPDGDAADFVGFEFPNNANPNQVVRLTLDCDFDGDDDASVRGVIFEDGVETPDIVECNEGQVLRTVDNTKVQVVRIEFAEEPDEDTYVEYTLLVVGFI